MCNHGVRIDYGHEDSRGPGHLATTCPRGENPGAPWGAVQGRAAPTHAESAAPHPGGHLHPALTHSSLGPRVMGGGGGGGGGDERAAPPVLRYSASPPALGQLGAAGWSPRERVLCAGSRSVCGCCVWARGLLPAPEPIPLRSRGQGDSPALSSCPTQPPPSPAAPLRALIPGLRKVKGSERPVAA